MNIMEETLISLMKLSPVVGILALIVWRQDRRIESHGAETKAREETMQKECREREEKMAARLTELENRQYKDSATLIQSSARATETFARALDRWVDHQNVGSGKHEARR